MNKRDFLAGTALATAWPLVQASNERPRRGASAGPAVLTIGGDIGQPNRGPLDPQLEQMMVKHGVRFTQAHALTAERLHRLPAVTIRPTLEYDQKPHALTGPLLTTVLAEAGVSAQAAVQVGLRAVDGYRVALSLADARSYRMIVATHLDGQPLSLGGLGPQWAVYDPESIPAFKDKSLSERFALCPWGLYYIDVTKA